MAVKLLDNASFGIIRTNPKLTTNVKVTYTSDSQIFLNSIDASFELNKSDFKNYKTSSESDYHWDLWRFWKKGNTPNTITHGLGDVADPTQIQSDYSFQYDLTYAMGAKYENSRFYEEEFSYFAPLWLNRTLPEKFMIFRIDNPSFFETGTIAETNENIRQQMSDPANFKKFILDNATIIKTVDLGPQSEIGKYIRRYLNQNDFPTQPINIRYEKDDFSTFSGINLTRGDFSDESVKLHTNLVARDQTIIEFDNYITKGFERNNLAIANILNLEFLFDDPEADDFTINRYFGLYVNPVAEGETTATELITLDDSRTQVNLTSTIYDNENIDDLATIFYLRDRTDKFYKIDADSNWDENQVIINERLGEDDEALLGFSDPVFRAGARAVNFKGYSYIEMEITDNPRSGDFYYLGGITNDYLISADHTISKSGTNFENKFSINGTNEEVALAIAAAVNYNFQHNELIRAYTRGNTVIVFCVFSGTINNSLPVSRRHDIFNNAIILKTENNSFFGGSDELENRIAIDISFEETINTEPHFVLTDNGFKQVQVLRYMAIPVTDTDGTILEFAQDDKFIITQVPTGNRILINEFNNVNFFTFNKNEYGFLSIFSIKDFDFDFHSTEYSQNDNSQMVNYYNSLNYDLAISESNLDLSDVSAENTANLLKYDFETTFKAFGEFTNLLGLEQPNGELEKIKSEYDRLNENFLRDLATYSRLSPFVCKWVKSGLNVKEQPYRLNTNYAFGLDNASPSFEIKTPNPQYFTHEWYYLGQYPEYVDKSNENIKNYYQFFENNFNLDEYLNPNNDYFTQYFTIEEKGDFPVEPEFKFSTFRKGSSRSFAQTFFRGAKLYVKKRRENETQLNFNVDNLEFLQSNEYNDYKFSAVLQPVPHFYTLRNNSGEIVTDGRGLDVNNPGERIPKVKFTVIENKKFKNITFFIEFKLPESNIFKFFFDSIFLYTYRSIRFIQFPNVTNPTAENFEQAIQNGDFTFVYPDTPLTSVYDIRGKVEDNRYQGITYEDSRKIQGLRTYKDTVTQALTELNVNPEGIRNTIKLYRKGTQNHIWEIKDILKIISNRILLANEISKDDNLYQGNFGNNEINFSNFAAFFLFPYYKNGGFNFFQRQIEDISFANIFELVNEGSPSIEYVTVPEDYDGSVPFEDLERNNFVIEFEEPFKIQKNKYLNVTEDTEIPPGLTTETSIGFALQNDPQVELLLMNRYGGDFFPKFNDVLKFTDKNSNTEDLKNLNREFDIENPKFGIIPNFYYSKVSPESFNRILTVNPSTGFSSRYPLIGEIGIDRKDFYTFLGNWELGYYQKSINRNVFQRKAGTWNTLEQKNFFVSKAMKIPEVILIEEFLAIDDTDTTSTEFDIRFSRSVPETVQMQVFLENRIISKLFEEGITDSFDRYVNYANTLQGDREEFISDYIRLNILPRYQIDEIIFWVNSSVGALQLPLVFNNLTDVEKIQNGYQQSQDFNFNTLRNSNFNLNLNGNLNTSNFLNFSTAITVRVVKR